jgi:uridine kinase
MSAHNLYPITRSEPRTTARVTFPDGTVLEGALGSSIEAYLHAYDEQSDRAAISPVMAAICNGKLRELSYPISHDSALTPVRFGDSDGRRIYRRSLVLLLTTAIDECFPNTHVNVGYAAPGGSFYCTLINRAPFTRSELAQVEAHMQALVAADEPIAKQLVPLDAASAMFAARGDDDKVRLLEARDRDMLTLYTLRGRSDYFYGYMLPSTRYLSRFRLHPDGDGFHLQYPTQDRPDDMPDFNTESKLSDVFAEAEDWLQRMGVEDMGRLNRIVRNDHVQELILVAEALHEQRVAAIANQICERHNTHGTRLVLIAGPTSSGKTTFSKRLAIQLLAHGLRPFTLELDNYFVDRERTPRDASGAYDFEALEAVDLALFNAHLAGLTTGEQVRLPKFDFVNGRSLPGRMAQLNDKQIMIIEGIHGLNPGLVTSLSRDLVYRIYISPLTALNIDRHNRVPTTDVRLLRRIVRDAATRGHDATATLNRWGSVRAGEKRNIFPFQENADAMFNSGLAYELAALRPLVEPLLLQVAVGTSAHIEANRLLTFLRWVEPLTSPQASLIPDTSLLREFIGGSILADYHPADGGHGQ